MIKHIVMWRLKDTALGNDKATNAQIIKQKLEALNGQIAGLLKLEVGIDFSVGEGSADLVLYSEFASRQALDDYQAHPLHKAVVPLVAEMREERRVVDYEI
ncbi:MAG: Dabb family protein [Gammaproteobacteria bacterium]|nr:Dabb family protein [Gammaproteobacteria bacterium]